LCADKGTVARAHALQDSGRVEVLHYS